MVAPIPNDDSEFAWLPRLLQASDSIFPSGSYAHSFGLEGLVQLGQGSGPAWLADYFREQAVPALEHLELPFVRLAYLAARDAAVPKLLELDERYGAIKGAFELREASSRIGAQRLQMYRKLAPHPLLTRLDEERAADRFQGHGTIVLGVQAAVSDTPLKAALMSSYYQALAALVSAAMKLIRLGQVAGQSLLTDCLCRASGVVERSLKVDERDIGWFQPLLDIASARHETAYTRIFIS